MTYNTEPRRHDVETWFEDTAQTVAFVALEGTNQPETVLNAEMRYTIVSGIGQFCIGNTLVDVEEGDVVMIPPGTPYQDRSEEGMVMLCTTTPPFDPSKTVSLSKSLFEELSV